MWYIWYIRLEQKIAGCVAAAAAARIGSTCYEYQNLRVGSGTRKAGVLDSTDSENFQKMTDVLAVSMYTGIASRMFPMMLFAAAFMLIIVS